MLTSNPFPHRKGKRYKVLQNYRFMARKEGPELLGCRSGPSFRMYSVLSEPYYGLFDVCIQAD